MFHLASFMGGIGFISDAAKQVEILHHNTLMDFHMLEAARQADIEKFFYSSSTCVFPMYRMMTIDYEPLREEDAYPADCNEGYGWEKLHMEHLCRAYHESYNMKTYIARFQNVVGDHCSWNDGTEKVVAALCRKVAEAKLAGEEGVWIEPFIGDNIYDNIRGFKKATEIEVWGDGEQTRAFMHVDDCVEGMIRLIQTDYHKPITLGPDRAISINDLVCVISDVAGYKVNIRHIPGPEGVRGRHFNHDRCREVLGWIPEKTIEEAVAVTYPWIEKQVRATQ